MALQQVILIDLILNVAANEVSRFSGCGARGDDAAVRNNLGWLISRRYLRVSNGREC